VTGETGGLRSVKLRPAEKRARIVPAARADGRPFDAPGVDVLGADADALVAAAAPVFAWFEALEPGVVVRTISLDFARGRVLANVEATGARGTHGARDEDGIAVTCGDDGRPRVVRVDPPQSADLFDRARPLAAMALRLAHARLALRAARGTPED
jgi:hypothetical protein